jgi:hypothetical protein
LALRAPVGSMRKGLSFCANPSFSSRVMDGCERSGLLCPEGAWCRGAVRKGLSFYRSRPSGREKVCPSMSIRRFVRWFRVGRKRSGHLCHAQKVWPSVPRPKGLAICATQARGASVQCEMVCPFVARGRSMRKGLSFCANPSFSSRVFGWAQKVCPFVALGRGQECPRSVLSPGRCEKVWPSVTFRRARRSTNLTNFTNDLIRLFLRHSC